MTDSALFQGKTGCRLNNIFVEIGGAGYIYSLGYERIILAGKQRKWGISLSVDIGNFGKYGVFPKDLMSNLGLSVIYGRRHKIEAELGWVWAFDFNVPFDLERQRWEKLHGSGYAATIVTFNTFGIGYRWQVNNRITLRAKPMIKFKYDFDYKKWYFGGLWGDIGICYNFGKMK